MVFLRSKRKESMSVYSMTGYASCSASTVEPDKTSDEIDPTESPASAVSTQQVGVEIRSVNARFLDFSLKCPDEMRALEPVIRELIASKLRRGKVELRLTTLNEASSNGLMPTTAQLNQLGRLESTIQGWLPQARPLSVNEILHWCSKTTTPALENIQPLVLHVAQRCLEMLRQAKAQEGQRMAQALTACLGQLRHLVDQAKPIVPQLVERQQQRFMDRWHDALKLVLGSSQTEPPSLQMLQERAMNEAAAYAIRLDVSEELVRLHSHVDEAERLLEQGGEIGKRLDFLAQELLREANTLASKSMSLEMTNLSLNMKVVIEQVREQVQNLE
jgi:uncharacterized protein (TIGR00255 family)